jgi:hypothetical protein
VQRAGEREVAEADEAALGVEVGGGDERAMSDSVCALCGRFYSLSDASDGVKDSCLCTLDNKIGRHVSKVEPYAPSAKTLSMHAVRVSKHATRKSAMCVLSRPP